MPVAHACRAAAVGILALAFTIHSAVGAVQAEEESMSSGYPALLQLFERWREFERPPILDGAPDYSAAHYARAAEGLKTLQHELKAIDRSGFSVSQQIDWELVEAEMHGLDFNIRVLQPWARDPAYYQTVWMAQSDTPAHEGPTNHATCEVWTYAFPLGEAARQQMATELSVIPPLLKQARANLTGNARDLWIAGISNLQQQIEDLDWLREQTGDHADDPLSEAIADGRRATVEFVAWLESQSASKTGPSGVGKEHYSWYRRHVHRVPLDWQQEVDLLQRELDRAWANLKLEERRNRSLPPLQAASTAADYDARADAAITRLMRFLSDKEVMPIEDYMEPAAREHLLEFVPEGERNFFDIVRHYDPLPLFCHWYHWFDLAQVRDRPHASPIRRGPLLYNIWDSRSEGMATGVEEMFMHMGLYEDSPRSREIVWIMLAQRAARGLGSLYAHANLMTMEQASQIHLTWTPRQWMYREPKLLKFEQHLYLRQPGYGTSYVVGKYLIEQAMARRAKQLEAAGESFVMRDFFAGINQAGNIPVVLGARELSGGESEQWVIGGAASARQ